MEVHRQDAVGAGRLDAIGADPRADRDPGLVLLVALGVGEVWDHRGDLHRAGPLERVDPEEQLDEVVVDRIVDALDDEDIPAPDVLEDADEDIALAEAHRLRLRQLHAETAADRLPQLAARAAGEDLQLSVGVGLLGGVVGADQRFVHAHVGRSIRRRQGNVALASTVIPSGFRATLVRMRDASPPRSTRYFNIRIDRAASWGARPGGRFEKRIPLLGTPAGTRMGRRRKLEASPTHDPRRIAS